MSLASQVSKDDFKSWKESTPGQFFFKEFLKAIIEENRDQVFDINTTESDNDYIIKEVVARIVAGNLAEDLQNIEYEAITEALGVELDET